MSDRSVKPGETSKSALSTIHRSVGPWDRRPLALQVRDELKRVIGGLNAGDSVPSEAELVSQLEVGRTTVREALKLLEQEGYLDVRQGKGRYVSASAGLKVDRPITRFESITELMDGLGYEIVNQVLDVRERGATQEEADALGLAPSDRLIELERLRLHKDDPFIYSINLIRGDALSLPVDEVDWTGSVSTLLANQGWPLVSSVSEISAAILPETPQVRDLGLNENVPWLLITDRCVNGAGQPVLLSHDYHRGDVFAFHFVRRITEFGD